MTQGSRARRAGLRFHVGGFTANRAERRRRWNSSARGNAPGISADNSMRPERSRSSRHWETIERGKGMSQSLARILVHLVFSTKHRQALLTPELRAELQPYLATVLDDNGCPSLQIGGVADHVHCLFGLSRTLTVAQVVELAKTSTSKWLETKGPAMATFSWQSGYGAFSVSESSANVVIAYIRNQEQHHGKLLFQDEFRALLQRHGIPYDERYVWD